MLQVLYRKIYKNSASSESLIFESAIFSGGFKGQNKVDQILYIVFYFLFLTGSVVVSLLEWAASRGVTDFGVVSVSVFCFALDAVCLIL